MCWGRLSFAAVNIADETVAAPPMSARISSIALDGLIEIPPLSKVTPLPIMTIGSLELTGAFGLKYMKCIYISQVKLIIPKEFFYVIPIWLFTGKYMPSKNRKEHKNITHYSNVIFTLCNEFLKILVVRLNPLQHLEKLPFFGL